MHRFELELGILKCWREGAFSAGKKKKKNRKKSQEEPGRFSQQDGMEQREAGRTWVEDGCMVLVFKLRRSHKESLEARSRDKQGQTCAV